MDAKEIEILSELSGRRVDDIANPASDNIPIFSISKACKAMESYHQAKSKEEAEERYGEAIENKFLENIALLFSVKLATEVNTVLLIAAFGKDES